MLFTLFLLLLLYIDNNLNWKILYTKLLKKVFPSYWISRKFSGISESSVWILKMGSSGCSFCRGWKDYLMSNSLPSFFDHFSKVLTHYFFFLCKAHVSDSTLHDIEQKLIVHLKPTLSHFNHPHYKKAET